MKIDGRCHCGKITYEAEIDPAAVSICHCTDCQQMAGSAFRVNVRAPASHFVIRGEPTSYIKTAESGNRLRHAFCGDCGTPIYSCALENPQTYNLRIGAVVQRTVLVPRRQGWRHSAPAWVDDLADMPATPKSASPT